MIVSVLHSNLTFKMSLKPKKELFALRNPTMVKGRLFELQIATDWTLFVVAAELLKIWEIAPVEFMRHGATLLWVNRSPILPTNPPKHFLLTYDKRLRNGTWLLSPSPKYWRTGLVDPGSRAVAQSIEVYTEYFPVSKGSGNTTVHGVLFFFFFFDF